MRLFKQSESLNYSENLAYIEISDKGRLGLPITDGRYMLKIDDPNTIKKVIDYLNSLELIEESLSEYEPIPDLNEVGYFEIEIVKVGHEDDILAFDSFTFMTDYVLFTPNKADWKGTRYYIKNSCYDDKTKGSRAYAFLYDLLCK